MACNLVWKRPPPLSDAEKKKREKMAKKGEMVEEKDDKDAWKRPWLITHEEDTDFEVDRGCLNPGL